MRFEMSGDARLVKTRARLREAGYTDAYQGTSRGTRPLLLVPVQGREDAVAVLRIVLDEDPQAQTLV